MTNATSKRPKPATEQTWMNCGATREQARELLAIPLVELTDDQVRDALRDHRATNMWGAAINWLRHGCAVVHDDAFFYRDIPTRDVDGGRDKPSEAAVPSKSTSTE